MQERKTIEVKQQQQLQIGRVRSQLDLLHQKKQNIANEAKMERQRIKAMLVEK